MDPNQALAAARLAPSQLANAKLIVRQFLLAGYPLGVALAAVVNAKAESNLDARAVAGEPRGGYSVGLFQLYDYGAGKGMAVSPGKPPPARDPRFDPARNTARILDEVRSGYGDNLRRAAQQGATVAQLAGIFARDIERPANADLKAAERAELARRMFGTVADAQLNNTTASLALMPALMPWWVWLLPVGAVGVALAAGLFTAGSGTRRL